MSAVRVLVAEDSRTARDLICELLREDASITIVGTAMDGVEAIDAARALKPDVITMDVHMPRMGGLEAIDRIMSESPCRILVVCSVADEHQVDLSFRSVAAGALEVLAKPRADGSAAVRAWGLELRRSIHLMAEIPVVRRRRAVFRNELGVPDLRVLGIGLVASTGGPPALANVLAGLPSDLPVPIFVAQHMAPGFAEGLVRWLGGVTSLPIALAADGARHGPGHVYLPPDRHDLSVGPQGRLEVKPSAGPYCPSADHLLVSMAREFGPGACAVVLTGMGDDGAAGVRAIRSRGGVAMAQDNASCIVYGMPQAAVDAGAVTVLMAQLAPALRELCSGRGSSARGGA